MAPNHHQTKRQLIELLLGTAVSAFLEFRSGTRATISIADKKGCLVV